MSGTHKIRPGKGHFFPSPAALPLGGQAAGRAMFAKIQPAAAGIHSRGSAIGQRKKRPARRGRAGAFVQGTVCSGGA